MIATMKPITLNMVWPERKSIVEKIELEEFTRAGVEVRVLRDDAIDPEVSGNKWRKLKYNILHAAAQKNRGILTFGGAFSNHIAATASAGRMFGLKTIGVIRGEPSSALNPTLSKAARDGMELRFVSREMYRLKDDPYYINRLHEETPNVFIVPEGGANYYGLSGCVEIMKDVPVSSDVVVVPAGTGTTVAGCLIGAQSNQKIIGVPVLKGGEFIRDEIRKHGVRFLGDEEIYKDYEGQLDLWTDYAFGGYAKLDAELVDFVSDFHQSTGVILDGVYTAKAMWGLVDQVKKGFFARGAEITFIHTGGVQGNLGLNQRYGISLPVIINK